MNLKYADRLQNLSGNAIREIFKLLASPEIISLAGGNPAPETFPCTEVARITTKLMEEQGSSVLQYGATEGWMPLRQEIVRWLPGVGIHTDVDHVLTTTGSQQGLDLVCKAMVNPGDIILVENPTFLGALHTMKTYQAQFRPVETDEDGLIPQALEQALKDGKPKFLYIIPTFQNPSGRTLTLERRKAIARIAAEHELLVVEDDPYRDLRYAGEALPSIASFDEAGYVLYLASFSKLISPGLRVGAAIGAPELMQKMTIGKQGADVHTSNLSQAIVAEFLKEGLLAPHIAELCNDYRVKMEAMLSAISENFPAQVKVTHPEGGLFVWATLPPYIDTTALLKKATEHNVAFVPGAGFHCDGTGTNTFRLNFSMPSVANIKKAIAILGEVISDVL